MSQQTVLLQGSASSRSLPTKGISKDFKRSFVKHRSMSSKPRYRLSEGEDPLNSGNNSPILPRHLSATSLDPPRVGYDLSSLEAKHRSTSDSPRIGMDSSPEASRGYNDRSPTNSKIWKELSPRKRSVLTSDHHSNTAGKTLSPNLLLRARPNSDYSSQSESSIDILSGSCDSLDNVTADTPTVNKSSSPPIRRGESSAIKVSSVDKKQVIKNLASITSITQVDEGSMGDNKIKGEFVKDCSPCGPDAQIICSHDISDKSHDPSSVSHDLNSVSHEPAGVSHDPVSVPHDPASVLHDPANVSHDPANVSHDDTTMNNNQSVSMDSNISSQSVHVDFLDDSSQQSLEDIAEEPNEVPYKRTKSIQNTPSMMSIGKCIYTYTSM